jgi:hypothetical protein
MLLVSSAGELQSQLSPTQNCPEFGDNVIGLAQSLAEIISDLDSVLGQAIDGHAGRLALSVLGEGSSRAPLVPLNEREVVLPARVAPFGEGTGGDAWPSVHEQHNRIPVVGARYSDPLLDAADGNVALPLNRG